MTTYAMKYYDDPQSIRLRTQMEGQIYWFDGDRWQRDEKRAAEVARAQTEYYRRVVASKRRQRFVVALPSARLRPHALASRRFLTVELHRPMYWQW